MKVTCSWDHNLLWIQKDTLGCNRSGDQGCTGTKPTWCSHLMWDPQHQEQMLFWERRNCWYTLPNKVHVQGFRSWMQTFLKDLCNMTCVWYLWYLQPEDLLCFQDVSCQGHFNLSALIQFRNFQLHQDVVSWTGKQWEKCHFKVR